MSTIDLMRAAIFSSLLLTSAIAFAGGHENGAAEPGQRLMMEACVQCHSPRPMFMTRDGRAGWQDTIEKMVVIGAQLTSEEIDVLADYMAAEFGPGASRMESGPLPPGVVADAKTSALLELPAGDGRELVQGLCANCHDLGRVVATRRSAESWRAYTTNMLAQGDITITEQQVATMSTYLARHFGK